MWNHRDLEDPLQKQIEGIIQSHIAGYTYGTRREDQTAVIDQSGLFGKVIFLQGTIEHHLNADDFIEGWKSHGTVYRQSPEVFGTIIGEIRDFVHGLHQQTIMVPYTTRIWMAQTKKG